MLPALRICLAALGASAVAIALSILLLGAWATASMAESVFDAVSGWRGPPSGPWPATMDSELRFYAALWGAYGALLLRAAWSGPRALSQTPWLAAVFFAGGVGRLLSRLSVGAPHPFFTLLMLIELSLPALMVLLWLGARTSARALAAP
jgi:hypothetical protein